MGICMEGVLHSLLKVFNLTFVRSSSSPSPGGTWRVTGRVQVTVRVQVEYEISSCLGELESCVWLSGRWCLKIWEETWQPAHAGVQLVLFFSVYVCVAGWIINWCMFKFCCGRNLPRSSLTSKEGFSRCSLRLRLGLLPLADQAAFLCFLVPSADCCWPARLKLGLVSSSAATKRRQQQLAKSSGREKKGSSIAP